MFRLERILFGLFLLPLCLTFSGCASTADKKQEQDSVTTLPWNAPEQWEHTAPIGGAASY